MRPLPLLLLLLLLSISLFFAEAKRSWTKQVTIDSSGCGKTKWCLMRPRGCSPMRDCTQGYMLSVVGNNQLKVEMFALSLVPAVPLQYLAIGYSKDRLMGDDMVAECVVSETGIDGGGEVFLSYNRGRSNDRIHFDDLEAEVVFSDIHSSAIDGRITCSFIQSLRPQLDSSHGGRIRDLDQNYFIFGATGSAQPDEVNPHDLNRESFYFPLTSDALVNPSLIGNHSFTHPSSTIIGLQGARPALITPTTRRPTIFHSVSSSPLLLSLHTLLLSFLFL